MVAKSEISACKTPAQLAGASVSAAKWWESVDGRRLPGEEGGYTVFMIEFWDGEDDGVTVMSTSVFERMVVELPMGRSMPTAEGVQSCVEDAGGHIDTAVVTKGVTGFAWARFELENWRNGWESNPLFGDVFSIVPAHFRRFLSVNCYLIRRFFKTAVLW